MTLNSHSNSYQKWPRKNILVSLSCYSVLTGVSLIFLIPLYILIRNAVSSEFQITTAQWYFWPKKIAWNNFKELFSDPALPFMHSIINSTIISCCQTLGILLISAMAGYAFARYDSRTARILWKLTLISLMLPATSSFVPNYILLASLGWLNSLPGIIIPSLFQAFSVVMFRQFFQQFPKEIEEAAKLDGLSTLGIILKIIAPNSLPIFASLGVLIFLENWNAFLWPFIVSSNPENWTIQLSLSTFLTSQSANFAELFAGTLISIIPALVIFLGLSQYMTRGVSLNT